MPCLRHCMAGWTMFPDKIKDAEPRFAKPFVVLCDLLITFFLAEIVDKIQVVTVATAAHFPSPVMVLLGTTVGRLIAEVLWVALANLNPLCA